MINVFSVPVFLSLLALLISSCSGNSEKDSKLKEAHEIHEASMSVRAQTVAALEIMKSSAESAEDSLRVKDLEMALKEWDDQVYEIPGFEHDHDHDHDHDHHHHHRKAPDLTPEQHLEMQNEMMAEIKALLDQAKQ